MINILFYGDSNTWGFDPETGGRYPYEERWTTICARELGSEYLCIPAGMNGRTTAFDDPLKGCRNGLTGLDYELQTHKPLDLLAIMLGTNDLKYTDAAGSAEGMRRLVDLALSANERFCLSFPVFPEGAKILLIAPTSLKGSVGDGKACDEQKEAVKLADLYQQIAREKGIHFMNAALYSEPSPIDGVHLGREGHKSLGIQVAQQCSAIIAGAGIIY